MGQMSEGEPLRRRGNVVWEGGHYYQAKGPTRWSHEGWQLIARLAEPHESRMLFVDDVHTLEQMHQSELEQCPHEFVPIPEPTHTVTESSVHGKAFEALERLKCLPKRYRAEQEGTGAWSCAGFQLTKKDGHTPLCLLYDLGLTLHKWELGFMHGINVLPSFYELEQKRLMKLAQRMLSDFHLDVVLYELEGPWRVLNPALVPNTAVISR